MVDLLATYIVFFAVIDPIGTVPVFIAVTASFDAGRKARIALLATVVAAGILLFFVVAGELILAALAIPLPAFQIAGGIVLFLFALTMIFGEGKPNEELKLVRSGQETAIFPLATPSIASPGAMLAAVLETENARLDLWQQLQVVSMMLAVLATACVLMLSAGLIDRIIGKSGASIVSKVMGMILAAVATKNVLEGLKLFFGI